MTEFVSGLPGRTVSTPAIDPRGAELLLRIRAHAKAEADMLAPLTVMRFDGVERLEPDPQDIAAKQAADAIVRLVDEIIRDPLLAQPIAARIVLGGGAD